MSVRTILLASVCSGFLAASAAVAGAAAATPDSKLVSQAYKALQVGDAEVAVQAYTKAIESRNLEPEVLANALLNRGLAYQRLNEHELAVDDYTAAMRIDAMSGKLRALALYNRGLSYQRLQRNSQAVEDYTSALFLDSQFSHAYYSRGVLLRDGGQQLFALADFDKALRFSYPEPARVYFAQSLTFEKLRRSGDARDALNKALAANPGYEPAVQRLAALDGKLMPVGQQASSSDQMVTAAVTAASTQLPEASAPSVDLVAEGDAPATGDLAKAKKIVDRVIPETRASRAETATVTSDATETVLAVETVPEETAAASAAPADPAAAVDSQSAAKTVTGWSVQIASAATEDAAWSTWKKMQAKHKALVSKEPIVVRADLGTKGVFYRIRLVGFDTQSDANSECASLKSKGVKCYISKAAS